VSDTVEYEIAADEIDGSFVPAAQTDVASVLVGNEIVLGRIAPGTRYVQTAALNESGSVVWQCFDGSGTIDEIAADIADVFAVDLEAMRADVLTVARDVGAFGFLVGVHETTDLEEPAGVAEGLPLPDFDARDEAGGSHSLAELRDRQALIVSWSDSCRWCEHISDDLAGLVPKLSVAGVDLVLLATGDAPTIRAGLDRSRFAGHLWLQAAGSDSPFDGLGTPVAYLVDEQGTVAAPVALGAPDVVALARAALSASRGSRR
jgi:hypothetical protein